MRRPKKDDRSKMNAEKQRAVSVSAVSLGQVPSPAVRFGLIVIDHTAVVFGTLTRETTHRYTNEIIHGFGAHIPQTKIVGGGATRMAIARGREEKRRKYLEKVVMTAEKLYLRNNQPIITGLLIAGKDRLENELHKPDRMHKRLQSRVIEIVHVDHGGPAGFRQAVELGATSLARSDEILANKVTDSFFVEVFQDRGLFCFGMDQTMTALEHCLVDTVIVWDKLDVHRRVMTNRLTLEETVSFVKAKSTEIEDQMVTNEMEITTSVPLVDWLAANHVSFDATLSVVTEKSENCLPFVKTFDGIGGILHSRSDFHSHQSINER